MRLQEGPSAVVPECLFRLIRILPRIITIVSRVTCNLCSNLAELADPPKNAKSLTIISANDVYLAPIISVNRLLSDKENGGGL